MPSRPGPPAARLEPSALPLVSSDDIVARLASEVPDGAILAFDADGTIWSGDIGVDTFTAMLESRAVKPDARPALVAEGARIGLALPDDPTDAARALCSAFERGDYPEDRAFQMMAWLFAGYTEAEARAFALQVIEKVSLASRLHAEVTPILRWAKSRSIPIFVVSASATIVVETAVERLGLPVTRVFGMPAAIEGGVVAPRLSGPATYGAGKIAALRTGIGSRAVIGAFGDSVYDLPMLGEARLSVAVRPKPELRNHAADVPGLVELGPPAA